MYKIEDYKDQDLCKLAELAKDNYGEVEIANEQYLSWLYNNNPAGKAIIKVAKDINNIIGQYILLPIRLKVENNTIKGSLSINTLIQKNYRGGHIYKKLIDEAWDAVVNKGLLFAFGFPNPRAYLFCVKRWKCVDIGSVPLLVKPINIGNLIRKRANSYVSWLCSPLQCFFQIKQKKSKEYEIYKVDYDNLNDINSLWDKIKSKYKIIQIRDAEFFKWRYLDIPTRKYNILGLKKDGEIVGYIVGICMEVNGINCGMIVDFLMDRAYFNSGKLLINEMLCYFRGQNADLAGTLVLKHTDEYKILRNTGFYKCPKFLEPQPFRVIYKGYLNIEQDKTMYDLKNWFLTMGDYDAV